MKFDPDVWYSFDFETSTQNKYACTVDRVCVLKFNIITGEKIDCWDFSQRVDVPQRILQHKQLKSIMASNNSKVAHNAGFDLYIMEKRQGIKVSGKIHDTYQMAKYYRNDLPAYDLKSLSWWLLSDLYLPLRDVREWIHNANMEGEDDIEFDMTKVPENLVSAYCKHDVEMTAKLAHLLYPKVKDVYAYQQEPIITRLVEEMEHHGIQADVEFYRRFIRLGNRRINYNMKGAADALGINLEESKPTGNALRRHLADRGEQRRTAKGMVRADDVVLRDHRDSIAVRRVERIRHTQKQVNTYATNILRAVNQCGIFHPGFNQSRAITRRFTASSLYGDNGIIAKGQVQNFPRGAGIRTGITAPPGFKVVKLDLASIEPRLGSHAMSVFMGFDYYCNLYKKDENFNMYLHVIENHTSHGKVSKKDPIYIAYKHGCLGVQYGVGVNTFHKTMVEKFELPYTFDDCDLIYRTIRKECPEFGRLQRVVSSILESQGYIEDDFGSVYYVPEQERYKGVNYYCQGCAGNVLKWWWIELSKHLRGGDYVWGTVHDELDLAVKDDAGAEDRVESYCNVLEKLTLFDLPIRAESSGLVCNWGEAG